MMQVSLIPWLQALQSSALPRYRKSCIQPPRGHIYFKHVWGGGAYFVVMQPRIKNKSKLPAREQTIPDQSSHKRVERGGGGGGGLLNLFHWKGGLL